MTDIQVRGTTDPDDIAVVLAVLRRDRTPAPDGISVWRRRRRAALATTHHRRPTEAR